jgi:hypothetical protein
MRSPIRKIQKITLVVGVILVSVALVLTVIQHIYPLFDIDSMTFMKAVLFIYAGGAFLCGVLIGTVIDEISKTDCERDA